MLSDAHAHLDEYSPQKLEEIIQRARGEGVEAIVAVSKTLESSAKTIALASRYLELLPAVGIHPWNALPVDEAVYKSLKELASDRAVVAISEIGLDFVRTPETKPIQLQAFQEQLRLARELDLPVSVHSREAHTEVIQALQEASGIRGAIHSFSGDKKMLADWLGLGFHISLGIAIISPEATSLHKIVPLIPLDRLLIETDSTAGRMEKEGLEPARVKQVAQKVAELRGMKLEEVAHSTTANLRRLLERRRAP